MGNRAQEPPHERDRDRDSRPAGRRDPAAHRPLDRRLAPRGPGVLGGRRAPGRPAQPGLVDLRRAPRLLGLADLERQLGVPAAAGLRRSPRSSCSCWSRCPTWSARCCGCPTRSRCRGSAAATGRSSAPLLLLVPTLLLRARRCSDPGTPYWVFCLIAATAGFGGGNFASSMANINFFYPAGQQGHGARPQRRRRQPRRRADPAAAAGASSAAPGSSAWSRPAEAGIHLRARRLRVRRAGGRGRGRGVPLHGQPRHRDVASRASSCAVRRASRTPGSWRSSTSARSARSSATRPRCRC